MFGSKLFTMNATQICNENNNLELKLDHDWFRTDFRMTGGELEALFQILAVSSELTEQQLAN